MKVKNSQNSFDEKRPRVRVFPQHTEEYVGEGSGTKPEIDLVWQG